MRIEMVTAETVKFLPVIFSNETTTVAESNEPTIQQVDENVESVDESCVTSEVSSESTAETGVNIAESTAESKEEPKEKEKALAVINPNEMDTKTTVQQEGENAEIGDENVEVAESEEYVLKEDTEFSISSIYKEVLFGDSFNQHLFTFNDKDEPVYYRISFEEDKEVC